MTTIPEEGHCRRGRTSTDRSTSRTARCPGPSIPSFGILDDFTREALSPVVDTRYVSAQPSSFCLCVSDRAKRHPSWTEGYGWEPRRQIGITFVCRPPGVCEPP